MKTQQLKELAQQATPWPWKWFTSNSHNRLSSVPSGKDGDVISAFKAVDGVACVSVSRADMAFIEAAHPGAVIELIERLEAAERERDELRAQLKTVNDQRQMWVDHCKTACAELDRRNAAAGERVGLQYMGDNGKWQDCASREVAESYGFTQFRELYTAAPPAVLPNEEREMWRNNLRDAGHALSDIRRFVEEKFKCVADLPSTEAVLLSGPEVKNESDAIIAALNRVAEFYELGAQQQQQQQKVDLPAGREFELFHTTAQDEPIKVMFMRSDEVLAALDAAGVKWEVKK